MINDEGWRTLCSRCYCLLCSSLINIPLEETCHGAIVFFSKTTTLILWVYFSPSWCLLKKTGHKTLDEVNLKLICLGKYYSVYDVNFRSQLFVSLQLHRWNIQIWMRVIDSVLINRIPCTRDPKCDVKEHALEFSTFLMNSQRKLHGMIAYMPYLVFTEKCQSESLLPSF